MYTAEKKETIETELIIFFTPLSAAACGQKGSYITQLGA